MAPPAVVLLMLVLPQLAGFAATRWWRQMWAWPLVAFASFAGVWYATLWAPHSAGVRQRVARGEYTCGMIFVCDLAILLAGLAVHLGGGAFLAWLDRRAHRAFPTDGGGAA